MKILAIGDPHGVLPKGLSKIIKDEKIDIIVCVGDAPPVPRQKESREAWKKFIHKANASYEKIVDRLCSYDLPVLLLKGNMYQSRWASKITRRIFSKHKNLIHIRTGKYVYRGVNFILFDMIFEPHSHKRTFSKNHKRKVEANKKRGGKLTKMLKELKDPILISHAPPYKILDKTVTKLHIGSKVLLSAIKKYPPKLLLCGHVHEAKGTRHTLGTKIYNLGERGDYKVFKV